MLRWFSWLCVASLFSAPLQAQTAGDAPPGTQPPMPWANKLFLPDIDTNPAQPAPYEIAHDFGTMPKGTLAVHKFTITNIYSIPMQVTEIRRTSEVVQAYPPQKMLQPNDKAEFIVTIDTARFTGDNTETIQVSFGPTNVSTATLRIKATSRADIMLAPGSFNFGIIQPGTTPTKSVTLEYNGKQKDWKITEVVSPAGPFDVKLAEAGKNKTKINVTLKKTAVDFSGPVNDTVQLRTNDPQTPVVTVHINGNLQAPIEVSNPKVTFPMMRIGQTMTFRVIVRGNNVGPFKIESLEDQGDGLSVQALNASAPTHTLIITFTPVKTGTFVKEVKLPTDLKSGAAIKLTIEAETMP
jgi:hypothetical protein